MKRLSRSRYGPAEHGRSPSAAAPAGNLRPKLPATHSFGGAATGDRSRSGHQGVALVITLILLSVITFMAVTFLAVSRRDQNAVKTMADQTGSRTAAETAIEHAKAELLAPILATTNPFNFELLVSTTYVNRSGFVARQPLLDGNQRIVVWPTNVNYTYPDGTPLVSGPPGYDVEQNLANLYWNPRPPVYVTNRLYANSYEFRYYLDLNRNGRYDTNGLWPVISGDPANPYYDTNGNVMPSIVPGRTLSNYFVGDPEWIGMLERPGFPHSSTNFFHSRFSYVVIPAGKTLDLNYSHNQAKLPNGLRITAEGFYRNQGLGSWELNLASFLRDLNTNAWDSYRYDTAPARSSVGVAFDDAFSLLRYRYGGNSLQLLPDVSVSGMFGPGGVSAFGSDRRDGYAAGPLITNYLGWNIVGDADASRTASPWPGSEFPRHFFTTQELFDRSKTAPGIPISVWGFTERLWKATTNSPSSYDRYTFYRLLSQLGTDSAPEPPGKLNLNYDNLVQRNSQGIASSTNFYTWQPLAFFTNAAERLLKSTYQFGAGDIPVLVSNNFVYNAGVHRLLQLAANLYDASTNRLFANATTFPLLPSVFRPVFKKNGNDVFIAGFVEEGAGTNYLKIPRDLTDPADVAALQPDDLVYGVPLVIGAKKGLPNFNEFAMQSVWQITRKLQVTRPSLAASVSQYTTNQMFVVGLSNVFGVEAWNSYKGNYPRAVDIIVANDLRMTLTNDYGVRMTLQRTYGGFTNVPANGWRGHSGANSVSDLLSFQIPLRTNVQFLPDSIFVGNPPKPSTNLSQPFVDVPPRFPSPQWGLTVTNKLRFIMVDKASGRLIDYVHMNALNGDRNLSEDVRTSGTGFDGLWNTNRIGGNTVNHPPMGVINQIEVSKGNSGSGGTDWNTYGINQPTGDTKKKEIDGFRVFMHESPIYYPGTVNTNLAVQVPFTPTRKISQYLTWQANDPLVHYTTGDLVYLVRTNGITPETLNRPTVTLKNLGVINDRYAPWGFQDESTDENTYNMAVKDPGVRRSDDWDFPTNKFATLGWLGRVHRGTPWQTIYLKSSDVAAGVWQNWTGNPNPNDAQITRPVNDRAIFDAFTTAFSGSAARGQLPINQTNLAAWSAVFGGMIALTNASSAKDMAAIPPVIRYEPVASRINTSDLGIDPAGSDPNAPLLRIVNAINDVRATNKVLFPKGSFERLGDILAVPELTEKSPFLDPTKKDINGDHRIKDAVYEWLPQQALSLLRLGETRFVIYAFGQTLRPARASIVVGGPFDGMCTNYQVTAETALRAVVRIEGAPDKPRTVVESYNILPPD